MRDQDDGAFAESADRLPSFLAAFNSIMAADVEGISKHQFRSLETDSVFSPVDLVLGFIPFEANRDHPRLCYYNYVVTASGRKHAAQVRPG